MFGSREFFKTPARYILPLAVSSRLLWLGDSICWPPFVICDRAYPRPHHGAFRKPNSG